MAVCDIQLKVTPEDLCTIEALIENFLWIQEAIDVLCCIETGKDIQTITPYRVFVGDNILLRAFGGDTWDWSGPVSLVATTQNVAINNVQLYHSGLYTVLISDTLTGCTYTKYIFVEVVDLNFEPTVELTPVPYIPTQNCLNESNLNQFIIDSEGGIWFIDIDGCAILLNGPCEDENINAVTSPVVYLGNTIQLFSNGGVSYSWAGPNGFSSALQNPTITNAALVNSGTYTVVITLANGCTVTKQISLFVFDDSCENENINAVTEPIVFMGDTIELFANGGMSYAWSGPNGFTSALQNPTIPNAAEINTGIYTVIITLANGCTVTKLISLSVFNNACENDNVYVSGSPVVCLNDNIELFANGGVSYAWTGPMSFVSILQNPTRLADDVNKSGNYVVVITLANGCTVTRAVYAKIIYCPAPVAGVSLNCEDSPSS